MKKGLLTVVFVLVIWKSNAQSETSMQLSKLVKIIETSDFKGLVNLARNLSYEVTDSSKDKNGSLIFITMKFEAPNNTLGCVVSPDKKINHISFTTDNKRLYEDLKKQAENLGFKAGSKSTGGFKEVVESQDFEKGNYLINISAIKKNGAINYEIIVMRW